MSGFFRQTEPTLPQHEGSAGKFLRRFRLWRDRRRYEYSYTHISQVAVLRHLRVTDEFSRGWLSLVGQRILEGMKNRAELEESEAAKQYHLEKHRTLLEALEDVFRPIEELADRVTEAFRFGPRIGAPKTSAKSLEDFSHLFRKIGLPPIVKDFASDRVFASMRLAGPNPVMLQRLSSLPDRLGIDGSMFRRAVRVNLPGWNDSLDAALAEGRLYLADYAALDGAELGTMPNGQKYLYAPLALFAVTGPARELLPVAIRCQQKPAPDNPVFLPDHGHNWLIAKTIVETADGNLHEASTHLARTHLVMEAVVLASYRQLADRHPLSYLLWPHFEGTFAINNSAWKHLVSDGGAVDLLMGGTIQTSRTVAVKSLQGMDLMAERLPLGLARRGVLDRDALPDYPYRDDALLYWQAIHEWVDSYVRLYYRADADVREDNELQAWGRELVSRNGGRLKGLPNDGALQTAADLIEVLAFVLYTCSVQHAAVNFPQYDCMSYVPNMPFAGYRPAPSTTTGATEADFLAMLPTMDMAELQMEVTYLLGSVHYTTLGQYGIGYFRDPRVEVPLKQFQLRLQEIGSTIDERNRSRQRPYETLIPGSIPQSINI